VTWGYSWASRFYELLRDVFNLCVCVCMCVCVWHVCVTRIHQAALKALQAARTTSPLLQQWQRALNDISTRHSVKLFCVLGHSGLDSSWNVMAHGDAQVGKWRGNWRMECVASTLHTTTEHGVSSITTADAHTSTASSRLNWRPRRFKWTRSFRRKTKFGFCACTVTFQLASTWRRNCRQTCKSVGPEPDLGVSRQNVRNKIKWWIDSQHITMWRSLTTTQRQTRKLISSPSPTAKTRLLSFNRTQSRVVTGLLSGHNPEKIPSLNEAD
jgi:hypothetical protein